MEYENITKSLNLVRASSQRAAVAHTFGVTDWATFTMECSFRMTSLPAAGELYGLMSIGFATRGAKLYIQNTAGVYSLRMERHAWFTDNTIISYNFTPTAGTWYHVSFSKDGSHNGELTLNGASVATGGLGSGTGSVQTLTSTVGCLWSNAAYTNYFNGDISLARIWDTVRTPTQLAANKCSQFAAATTNMRAEYSLDEVYTDASGNGYTLTSSGSPTFTVNTPSFCLSLVTNGTTNIGNRTATLNGELFRDGGETITTRGFVYDTTPAPTISDTIVTTSGTIGVYLANIASLLPATTYYVRALATTATRTVYGKQVSYTTGNVAQYELQKEIGAVQGQVFLGQINITGATGTVTVRLGSTGTATVITAGAGAASFSGTYSGTSGLIITRSASFNGTIDNIYYVATPLGTTVNWDLDSLTIVSAIDSSVFFKRIEDDVFNSFRFYRYLDLLFKDLDGYVTVTVRDEREDITTERQKTFSVGNIGSGTVSPFQKKRVSFLIKNQAVIIGLSNGNISETFSIAQFLLTGHKKPQKNFSPSKIQSLS